MFLSCLVPSCKFYHINRYACHLRISQLEAEGQRLRDAYALAVKAMDVNIAESDKATCILHVTLRSTLSCPPEGHIELYNSNANCRCARWEIVHTDYESFSNSPVTAAIAVAYQQMESLRGGVVPPG